MSDHRSGRWAQVLLASQQPDGTWPNWCFHSMAEPGKAPLCTEQALRRLHTLGFTLADEPVRRIVSTMAACLRGERKIDTYWERGIDWVVYEPLMLAAWIRRFDPDNPDALAHARRWAQVIEAAFASGDLDEAAYCTAYEAGFRRKNHHPQPVAFTPFYHGMLLPGVLSPETEQAMLRHILHRPDGMFYVYPQPLLHPPVPFASKETSRWLGALEVLAAYPAARDQLAFAAAHLYLNAYPGGTWDLGPKANDKIYFPLSDSWRSDAVRRADCTERILQLLERIGERDRP